MSGRPPPIRGARPRGLAAAAGATILLTVGLGVSARGQDARGRIPVPRLPPPLAPALVQPLGDSLRLVVEDVAFTTALGHRVRVERLEIVVAGESLVDARHLVRVPLMRVVRPVVVTPPDTVASTFDPFVVLPGPRLEVGRVLIEDAELGALAHPAQYAGRWLWHARRLDADLRDVRIDGAAGSVRVAALGARGERRGEPFHVLSLAARLVRTASRLDGEARMVLPGSAFSLAGGLRRAGGFRVALDADSLAFAELRALKLALPTRGTVQLSVLAEGGGGTTMVAVEHARARFGDGELTATGTLRTGVGGGVEGARVEVLGLAPPDLGWTSGPEVIIADRWSGVATAAGDFRELISVKLDIASSRGMAVGGGLNVRGPTASMRVDGGLTGVFAVPASPGTSGTRDRGEATVSARIEGTLALPRILDVRAIADSIPLRLMRFPSAVDFVRGVARAELRATGQLDDPALSGSLALRDGGLRVRPIGVVVSGLAGVARLANDTLVLDSIRGRANGGPVSLTGTVSLAPDRTVDARLAAAGVRLAGDNASARILGFAEARVQGPLDRPRALAEARLLGIGTAGPIDTATIAIGRIGATLAEGGALDARFTADSLPLRVLPAPVAISDLRGRAHGELRVSGTLERPRLDGALRLEDAALRVIRTGTVIDALSGRVRLEDGRAALEHVVARAGEGRLALAGEARIAGGPRTLDVTLTADRATLAATDSATVVASARLRASGPPRLPTLEGSITLLSGRVHEDNFTRSSPVDLDAPRWAELVERVPWLRESRLRRPPAARSGGAPFRGTIVVDITPGMVLVDEDSELSGAGRLAITGDSTGVHTSGAYGVEAGSYAQYGEVMKVAGGTFRFTGRGFEPRATLRSEHDVQRPLGTGLGEGMRLLDEFPLVESFAIGRPGRLSEEARRLALLPETETTLGALLLYGVESQPVRGLRASPLWPPDDAADLVGERAETQSAALLWGYIANELYDFVRPTSGYLRAGIVRTGSGFPGQTTVAPTLGGAARAGPLEALLTQPLGGHARPGLRLRYRAGGWEFMAFEEPAFISAWAVGGSKGFIVKRRSGIGIRWESSFHDP